MGDNTVLKSKKILIICTVIIISFLVCSCQKSDDKTTVPLQKKLNILFESSDIFKKSINNAKIYTKAKGVICGIVPHHLVAANLIAGFFKSIGNTKYDTVIIIAPDQGGGTGQAITSKLNWSVKGGDFFA